ncbi:MAG: transporter substrate-binding domain-containing protein [bacterium]|nr:transporter substrate-binding domain-containing protein [bacterium]
MPPVKGFLFVLLGIISVLLLAAPLRAEDKNMVVLLSLEWPPYTGVKLPANGFTAKRVKAAYAAQGQEAKIGFYPWRRAMRLPYTDHRFTGFFPTYPSAERKQVCYLSDPVGVSPVGLAELRKKPLGWKRIEDLTPYRIGVVTAYANEDSFDRLVKNGSIKTTNSETDADNLLHLLSGRIDAAVIDIHVFDWLLAHDVRLQPYRDRLQMNERLLVTWPTFVCFRKDAEGAALRDQFNAGLASLHDEVSQAQDKDIKAGKAASAGKPGIKPRQ